MNNFSCLIVFSFLLLAFSCTNNTSIKEEIVPKPNILSTLDLSTNPSKQILIFKKEQKWIKLVKKENNWVIKAKGPITNTYLLPIGKFQLHTAVKEESVLIDFPNDLYRRKAVISDLDTSFYFQLFTGYDTEQGWEVKKMVGTSDSFKNNLIATTLLILPNDPRQSGRLTPCLYCPHWYAEVYGQLYLELRQLQPIFNL